jgi:NAD+ diphosphatase
VAGQPWCALDVTAHAADATRAPEAELAADAPSPLADARWAELRAVALTADADVAALLAQARGLLAWHARHPRCAVCGEPTAAEEAGYVRRCTRVACGALHFPRTDPAVIALVTLGDRCLLANGAAWPASLQSAVAGYVEPGESLEDAVRREVREETGVTVGAVRYVSSQPWPFPSSLMLGFVAEAASETIRVDGEEVRSARWFSRAELDRAVADGSVTLPSRMSIAWSLVEGWRGGTLPDPRG